MFGIGSKNKKEQNEAAAKYWDDQAKQDNFVHRIWLAHPLIQKRIQKLVTGDENKGIWQWAFDYLSESGAKIPVDTLLSVGCGTGPLERGLTQMGVAREIVGFDISSQSIEAAKQNAIAGNFKNISYAKRDLNIERIFGGKSQVIVANMAVHHIENLELFFDGCYESLDRSGWIVLNEYIGPKRFQWSVNQLKLINRFMKSLPQELRRLPSGLVRPAIHMPLEQEMIEADPSESVRSNEIIPVMRQYFDIVEYRSMRGALLHQLVSEIVSNFMLSDVHAGYISVLSEVEDVLTEAGLLEDDFAFIIGRPRQDRSAPDAS